MNGLDCAKCQKSRQKGHIGNYGKCLMRIRQKLNSLLLHFLKQKTCRRAKSGSRLVFEVLDREGESSFSLDFWPFRPSVLDGERSKVDLRREGYAWTPIWWNSDNSKR